MAQPSTRRIVTEAALSTSQSAQDAKITNQQGRIENIEVLGGLAPGDTSDATVADLLLNPATNTAKQVKSQYVAKGELGKNVRDYKLPGAVDDNAAMVAAHAANPAVFYPDGNYNPGANSNLYNSSVVKNAIGPRWMAGRTGSPIADVRPIMWAQKTSNSSYGPDGWDQGAGYFALIKESGDSYGAAITGYAATFGGSGDTAGVHGRARIASDMGNGFGGWFYNHVTVATPGRAVGIEVNVRNDSAVPTWAATSQVGAISILNLALSDGTHGAHHGIRFPQRAADNMQRLWTGLQFDNNTIMPTDVDGNGEAVRIRGANYVGGRYGGVTFGDAVGVHELTYGLRAIHATFKDNNAVQLAKDHRIYFGPDLAPATATWVSVTAAGLFDVRNANIAQNGIQVVRGRKTGWGTATGTADRTALAAYTAPTYTAAPTMADIQALANRLQLTDRHLVALLQDLHGSTSGHGLIGA